LTFVPTTGATAAAAAAEARARALREEEEQMTKYSADDLDGWEFKIVRAVTQKFKDRAAVQRICAEEAGNGWELVEKFDNTRIRFKRRIERRAADENAAIDPYRTQVGIAPGALFLTVIAIALGLVGLAVAAALLLHQGS
jgi:peptide subunit release factor RF-3